MKELALRKVSVGIEIVRGNLAAKQSVSPVTPTLSLAVELRLVWLIPYPHTAAKL